MAWLMNFRSGSKIFSQQSENWWSRQIIRLYTNIVYDVNSSKSYISYKMKFFLKKQLLTQCWCTHLQNANGWPVPNMQIRSVPWPSSKASCPNKLKPGKIFLMARLNYLVDTDLKNDCLLLNLKYFTFQYWGAFLRINSQLLFGKFSTRSTSQILKEENDGMHF